MAARSAPAKRVLSAAVLAAALVAASAGCNSAVSRSGSDLGDQVDSLLGIGDPHTAIEINRRLVRREQAFVAACMKELGFKYKEVAADQIFIPGPQLTLNPREFAEKFGLGYISLSGPNAPESPRLNETDANDTYVGRLSASERTAWYNGSDTCEERKAKNVRQFADLDAVRRLVDQFKQTVRADPKVVDATIAWAACMHGKGFSYSDPDSMRSEARKASERLISIGAGEESSSQHPEFHAQESRERSLGVADFECGKSLRATVLSVVASRRDNFIKEDRQTFTPG